MSAIIGAVPWFSYDESKQIDVRSYGKTRMVGNVIIRDVTFASPISGRIPAFIVIPTGHRRFPGILFAHWAIGDRAEFLPEAIAVARHGIASILPDAPFVRPAPWTQPQAYNAISKPAVNVRALRESIIDLRRSVDVLSSLPNIDLKRLAYVGHSFNADVGGVLLAVDHRFCAAVLMGGSGNQTDFTTQFAKGAFFAEQGAAAIHASFKQPIIDHYSRMLRPFDADRFIAKAGIPIYMQFALQDAYTSRSQALDYYAHAVQPKKIDWYLGGHEINNPSAVHDRHAWLLQRLGECEKKAPRRPL